MASRARNYCIELEEPEFKLSQLGQADCNCDRNHPGPPHDHGTKAALESGDLSIRPRFRASDVLFCQSENSSPGGGRVEDKHQLKDHRGRTALSSAAGFFGRSNSTHPTRRSRMSFGGSVADANARSSMPCPPRPMTGTVAVGQRPANRPSSRRSGSGYATEVGRPVNSVDVHMANAVAFR
jgi:hypothetical protein